MKQKIILFYKIILGTINDNKQYYNYTILYIYLRSKYLNYKWSYYDTISYYII